MKVDFFYDKEKGEVFIDGISYEITNRDFPSFIQKKLREIVGPPTKLVMYSAFRKISLKWSSLIYNLVDPNKEYSKKEIVSKILSFFPKLGYGVAEIIEWDEKKCRFKIKLFNSFNAMLFKGEKEPVCHLARGLISGIFEVVFLREIESEETKCLASGDELCEFEVRLTKKKSEEAEKILQSSTIKKRDVEKMVRYEVECNEEVGEIEYRGVNSAAILRGYTPMIQIELESLMGEASKSIGMIGKDAAKKALGGWGVRIARIIDKKRVIEEIMKQIPERGWGVGKLVKFDEKKNALIIRIKNCYNAMNYKKSEKPVCYTLAAVIEGAAEIIFGKPMKCVETKCIAKGDSFCEFKVEPTT